MARNITVNILDLYLDAENPRHDPIHDQSQILDHLVKEEAVKKLAAHIAKYGLNPLDYIGVIRNKNGKYIVIEGNRRVCALVLLYDPDRCSNSKLVKYFKEIGDNSSFQYDHIDCILFENRNAAQIWIACRHEGEQDGIGTRQWKAEQKTRFSAKKGKKDDNALAQTLMDYGKKHGFIPEDCDRKILTTASRFLGNPYFRKTLGIKSTRRESNVILEVAYDEFDLVIKKFLSDLIDPKSDVNSRTSKTDVENYASKLFRLDLAPRKDPRQRRLADRPALTKYELRDQQEKLSESSNEVQIRKISSQTRLSHDPDSRKNLLTTNFRLKSSDTTLNRVYEEIKDLNIEKKTLATALLARVFLEYIYHMYYEKSSGQQQMRTHTLIEKVVAKIEKDRNGLSRAEKNALGALQRLASEQSNALNPKNLGAFAHGGLYPSARELRRSWDNISAIIEYMIERI